MAGKLGRFLTLQFTGWKGLTKESHLSSIFQTAPLKASNLMVQLLATYRGKSLETFLSKFPIKTFDSDDEYTWDKQFVLLISNNKVINRAISVKAFVSWLIPR